MNSFDFLGLAGSFDVANTDFTHIHGVLVAGLTLLIFSVVTRSTSSRSRWRR